MGINGLLPQLRSITKRVHVSTYSGRIVAIDAYCLLHRGAYACPRELVEGEPTEKHISYCWGRIEMLLRSGVTPIVVFDGGPLPNKGEEERARCRSRGEARERARQLWRQGNRTAALECYQRAVDITPETAHDFVRLLRARGVRFIVAPYEADAQMAYLALNGHVHAVLTEDSDLLTYGCPVVLLKADGAGDCDQIRLADLPNCQELSFAGWTQELFQQMCVMAGCDFVKGLPGIGIKRAHGHIRRTRDFLRALRALRFDGIAIPPGYDARFQRALWTFRHQRVYCPERRAMVHLTQPPGGSLAAQASVPAAAALADGEIDFLGPHLQDDIAQGIAEGKLHPVTHSEFDVAREIVAATGDYGNGRDGNMHHNRSATATATAARRNSAFQDNLLNDPSFVDEASAKLHQISDGARRGFKRPRVLHNGATSGASPPSPSAEAYGSGNKRLPALPSIERFFPKTKGADADAAAAGAKLERPSAGSQRNPLSHHHRQRATLRHSLKAALGTPGSCSPRQSDDENSPLQMDTSDAFAGDDINFTEQPNGLDLGSLPSLLLPRAQQRHAGAGGLSPGQGGPLGKPLVPLWLPSQISQPHSSDEPKLCSSCTSEHPESSRACGDAHRAHDDAGDCFGATGMDAIAQGIASPLEQGHPLGVTPGFYCTSARPRAGNAKQGTSRKDPTTGGLQRRSVAGDAERNTPRQLAFAGDVTQEKAARPGAKAVPPRGQQAHESSDDGAPNLVDHPVDLSHMPAVAAEADAAVAAAAEHARAAANAEKLKKASKDGPQSKQKKRHKGSTAIRPFTAPRRRPDAAGIGDGSSGDDVASGLFAAFAMERR